MSNTALLPVSASERFFSTIPAPIRTLLLAIAGLWAGFTVRITGLAYVQYRHDDNALFQLITALLKNHTVVLHGMPSSVGIPNGPFQVWLLAPFAITGPSPLTLTAGVIFLNVFGLVCIYSLCNELFDTRTALIALWLAALNPWAVIFSRRLLGNDLIPPLAALLLWMLVRWLHRGDQRAFIISAVVCAIAAQVYVLGLELLIPMGCAMICGWRRLRVLPSLAAVMLFGALFAPYASTELIPHLTTFVASHRVNGTAVVDFTALRYALELASNEGYQAYASQLGSIFDVTTGWAALIGLFNRVLFVLGWLLLWFGIAGACKLSNRPTSKIALITLIVATVTPVLAVLYHPIDVSIDILYLVGILPLPSICQALALNTLFRWSERQRNLGHQLLTSIGVLPLIATLCLDTLLAILFFQTIAGYWPKNDYGIPWKLNDATAHIAAALAHATGARRILVATGNGPDVKVLADRITSLFPATATFDGQYLAVASRQPALIVFVGDTWARHIFLQPGMGRMLQTITWPGAHIQVAFVLTRTPGLSKQLGKESLPLHLTAGPSLVIDSLSEPQRLTSGAHVDLLLLTHVAHQPRNQPDLSVFAHLLSSTEKPVAGRDEPFWPTHNWQRGDQILVRLPLTIRTPAPPGAVKSLVGFYAISVATGQPTPLMLSNSTKQPIGPYVTIENAFVPFPQAPPLPLAATVTYQGGIILDGYSVTRPGDTLHVTLRWVVTHTVSADFTAYVHLLDGHGHLVAQNDSQPDNGHLPTRFWRQGDIIADLHVLRLPATLPPGPYTLLVGLYGTTNHHPLAVVSGSPILMLPGSVINIYEGAHSTP